MKHRFFVLLLQALAASSAPACEGLQVADARILEAPPGAGVLAGFMSLYNAGGSPLTLTAVDSPDVSSVEIHSLFNQDGVVKMVAEHVLPIPPHGTAAFKAGERHLMLLHPKRDFRAGDHVTVKLHCDGGVRNLRVPVEKAG